MLRLFLTFFCAFCASLSAVGAEPVPGPEAPAPERARLVAALLAPSGKGQIDSVRALVGLEDAALAPTLTAWRGGELFLVPLPGGASFVPAVLAPAAPHAPGAAPESLDFYFSSLSNFHRIVFRNNNL